MKLTPREDRRSQPTHRRIIVPSTTFRLILDNFSRFVTITAQEERSSLLSRSSAIPSTIVEEEASFQIGRKGIKEDPPLPPLPPLPQTTHLEYPERCAEVFICSRDRRRHDHYSSPGLLPFSLRLFLFPLPPSPLTASVPFYRSFGHKHRCCCSLEANVESRATTTPRNVVYALSYIFRAHAYTRRILLAAPQIGASIPLVQTLRPAENSIPPRRAVE